MSLGKNLKISTFDGKTWFPTFYDIDTCLGIDNSGYQTIKPDVEIEEGSFNTSNSNLWKKVLNYFASELKEEWALMRQGNFTLENIMKYVDGEQISKIPAKAYNDDAQVKYLDFGSLYTYCAHGNKQQLVTRWLRERIAYVDSMMGYFTSQDDQVTIRMNKTGHVEFSITPYIPLYFSVKWSNASGGVETHKLKRGQSYTYSYNSTTNTDQEVIIYHAKHIKRIDDISNLNPSSCILSNAKKLTEVEIHSDKLYNINVTSNKFLRKLDLQGCRTLGTVTATGSKLDLSNCKYLKHVNTYNTALTEVLFDTTGGSLLEVHYPKTLQSLSLIKQSLLKTVGLPYGTKGEEIPTALYSIEIRDCPSITKLNTSIDNSINNTLISMMYCNNLNLRNSLDFEILNFGLFHRLKNVQIANMNRLKSLGFDNMLRVGDISTLRYIGVSNCPLLTEVTMNCTSNDYEVTFADNALLNLGSVSSLKSITSNSIIKGLKTIVIPKQLESMYFTNSFGSGYSSIANIWSGSVCSVNTEGSTPIAIHQQNGYEGIDFKSMNLKNIDLGALVNIPNAINFSLSPTSVNPNFNKNRDGVKYPYLQPIGTLDLSNYKGSLTNFFDGVDLDKLEILCSNDFVQTDFTSMFEGAIFSINTDFSHIVSKIKNPISLAYMFRGSNINKYIHFPNLITNPITAFMYQNCLGITKLENETITSSNCSGMFMGCSNLVLINNITINSYGTIQSMFSACTKLSSCANINIISSTNLLNMFSNCSSLKTIELTIPINCTTMESMFNSCKKLSKCLLNISNSVRKIDGLFSGCNSLTDISGSIFGSGITTATDWLLSVPIEIVNNITVKNNIIKTLFKGNTIIKNISFASIPQDVKDLASAFEGCTNLVQDIDIPLHIENVTNIFKDCIKMTHIRSNWKKTYTNGIISVNAYAGCTGITHCDGIDLGISEYVSGLDEVPTAWGGYGFTSETTTMIIIQVPSDNYIISPYSPLSMPLLDDGLVDWGDGNITVGRENHKHTYEKAGRYVIKGKILFSGNGHSPSNEVRQSLIEIIKLPTSAFSYNFAFSYCQKLTRVRANNLSPTSIASMFSDSPLLSDIDVSSWNLSNCTDIQSAFKGCASLTTLDISNWNTSKVTNMSKMLNGCTSLTSLIGINTINVESLIENYGILSNTPSLQIEFDFTRYNKSKVYDISFYKSGVTQIIGLDNLKIKGDCSSAFQEMPNIKRLDLSRVDTIMVTHHSSAWVGVVYKNPNMEYLDISNYVVGSNFATNWQGISYFGMYNHKLKTLVARDCNFLRSNSTYRMFEDCYELTDVDFSGTSFENFPNMTGYNSPFINCKKLTNFTSFTNIKCNMDISHLELLTVDSLISVISNLVNVGANRNLIIGSKNLAKLTPSQIKIATDKNWTVV